MAGKKKKDLMDEMLERAERGEATGPTQRYGSRPTPPPPPKEGWAEWFRRRMGGSSKMPPGATLSPSGDLGWNRQREGERVGRSFKPTPARVTDTVGRMVKPKTFGPTPTRVIRTPYRTTSIQYPK